MPDQKQTKLMYRPYSSLLSPGFWQILMNLKLNKLRLSQEPVEMCGSYSCALASDLPCMASFDESSFNVEPKNSTNPTTCQLYGRTICFNTSKELFEAIGSGLLKDLGSEIWTAICSGEALSDPEKCLNKFGLLVHGDLKKFKFTFMFAYPALIYPNLVNLIWLDTITPGKLILDIMNENALSKLQIELQKSDDSRSFQKAYFIITCSQTVHNDELGDCKLSVFPLQQYNEAKRHCIESHSKLFFAFNDPSGDLRNPGWPMRNFVALIWKQFKLTKIDVIRIRMGSATKISPNRLQHSIVMQIEILAEEPIDQEMCPKISGWEADDLGKICPRKTDLSKLLDPRSLAADAVDLNLRLMKWRLLPSLNLEAIASSRCLLIGCGTLGCHVARGLLAWGVKNITLIDNSRVSYSNPVRQSLYFFEDCAQQGSEGLYKAEVAAKRLLQIHPTVNVNYKIIDISMPGHKMPSASVMGNFRNLEKLIKDHDTIFLMTDTRESRWVPTALAMANQKLLINSAIGFDTFLIQRHAIAELPEYDSNSSTWGPRATSSGRSEVPADELGCYFCNDIVAPGNSTLDRTLDQQCTVTRPGVSMLVSALVVEFYASIMSSPLGPKTPAPAHIPNDKSQLTQEDLSSELGIIPHSIRGDISRYHIYMPTSTRFNKCSACSPQIVCKFTDDFVDDTCDFVLNVNDDPEIIERRSGLKELHDFDTTTAIALDSDEDFADDS